MNNDNVIVKIWSIFQQTKKEEKKWRKFSFEWNWVNADSDCNNNRRLFFFNKMNFNMKMINDWCLRVKWWLIFIWCGLWLSLVTRQWFRWLIEAKLYESVNAWNVSKRMHMSIFKQWLRVLISKSINQFFNWNLKVIKITL